MSGRRGSHGGSTARGTVRTNNTRGRGRGGVSSNTNRAVDRSSRNGNPAAPDAVGDNRGGNAAGPGSPRISRQELELVARHGKIYSFY